MTRWRRCRRHCSWQAIPDLVPCFAYLPRFEAAGVVHNPGAASGTPQAGSDVGLGHQRSAPLPPRAHCWAPPHGRPPRRRWDVAHLEPRVLEFLPALSSPPINQDPSCCLHSCRLPTATQHPPASLGCGGAPARGGVARSVRPRTGGRARHTAALCVCQTQGDGTGSSTA